MNTEVENGLLRLEMLFSQVQDITRLITYRENKRYRAYHKQHKKLPADYVRKEWLGLELQFIQRALSLLNTVTGTTWYNRNILTIRYTLEEYRKYVESETERIEKSSFELATKPSKLSIGQIALYCVYKDIDVTKENANDIIKCFGLNSGEALIKKYNLLKKKTNRISSGPLLGVSDKTRAEDIKTVIDYLETEGVDNKKAIEELKELEGNIKQDTENSD